MALKTLSALPVFADSLFADRFNRIDRLFSQLTGDTPVGTLPAYDLQKVDDSNFLLSVSVPGWKDDELEIETVGGICIFPGNARKPIPRQTAVNAGFIKVSAALISSSVSLPEHAQINQAQLDSGILKIAIHQEIPESEKPRKIAIENQGRVIEHKV
jgi:molecular chaperone IbpA